MFQRFVTSAKTHRLRSTGLISTNNLENKYGKLKLAAISPDRPDFSIAYNTAQG